MVWVASQSPYIGLVPVGPHRCELQGDRPAEKLAQTTAAQHRLALLTICFGYKITSLVDVLGTLLVLGLSQLDSRGEPLDKGRFTI